jgi:hypothetical protein
MTWKMKIILGDGVTEEILTFLQFSLHMLYLFVVSMFDIVDNSDGI